MNHAKVCFQYKFFNEPGCTINHRFAEFHCILCKCKKIVCKDNDFIPALLFMETYKKLTGSELVRVHYIKSLQIPQDDKICMHMSDQLKWLICHKIFSTEAAHMPRTCFFLEFSFFRYSAKNSLVIGHHTSAHWTFAMKPPLTKSSQLASYSFGPMRKFKSVIFSSSLTRVAVSPSLQWDFVMLMTFLNIWAGTTCTYKEKHTLRVSAFMGLLILETTSQWTYLYTSSMSSKPHSLFLLCMRLWGRLLFTNTAEEAQVRRESTHVWLIRKRSRATREKGERRNNDLVRRIVVTTWREKAHGMGWRVDSFKLSIYVRRE